MEYLSALSCTWLIYELATGLFPSPHHLFSQMHVDAKPRPYIAWVMETLPDELLQAREAHKASQVKRAPVNYVRATQFERRSTHRKG